MTSRIAMSCFVACLVPALAFGQTAPQSQDESLTVDAAVRLAVEHNRQVQSARLEVQKAEAELAVSRTRRLPTFASSVTASQLLTPVSFAFPRGAFGEFPGTGPIPAVDTNVSVQRQPTLYVKSQISQPISQLLQIGLGIRSATATRDLERERARAQQLSVVNAVKRLYFAILQTESALAADDEAMALYQELDRTVAVRVAQKVSLRSDATDVQYRLAEEELSRTTHRNALASQKEQLNQLMGRDVLTAFDVAAVSTISVVEVDLQAAVQRALDNRPDVREAKLSVMQAELSRGLTKADRLPEVSVAVSYSSNFNMDVLPRNMATVGVQVTWEPFDWGRSAHEYAAKSRAVEQARLGVRDTLDRAVIEINSRFRTLAETRAQLKVAEIAQAGAREKLRVTTNQFRVQAVLLSGVLQQRAELADTDDRYQEALLAFWTAKADFEQALGEDVIR